MFIYFCSVHVVIKETISVSLLREGGIKSMELKGDMNLQVVDPSNAHIKLALAPFSTDLGSDLQFKQHPNVAKFAPNQDRIIALKDPSRAFQVGQALAVLKWRYAGHDDSYVPLSSKHPPFSLPLSGEMQMGVVADMYCSLFSFFFSFLSPHTSQLLAVPLQRWHVRRQYRIRTRPRPHHPPRCHHHHTPSHRVLPDRL